MLGFGKNKGRLVSRQMRELMFGDSPWEVWCRSGTDPAGPWTKFNEAWAATKRSDVDLARQVLLQIVAEPGHESRQYAQAWHFLRELGQRPPSDESKHVFGVVVEVGMSEGLDVLCAYEDHTARYWNFSG